MKTHTETHLYMDILPPHGPAPTPVRLSLSLAKPVFFAGCPHSCSVLLTLWDCMDCSLPGSSAHGIFQAGILEWVAIVFFRGSSPPRDWTHVLASPTLTGRFFTHRVSIAGKASNREQPLIKKTNCTIAGGLSSLNSFYSGRINCSFSHPTYI